MVVVLCMIPRLVTSCHTLLYLAETGCTGTVHLPFTACVTALDVSFSVGILFCQIKNKWTLPSHTPLTQWKEEVVILACIHSHTHTHTHTHKHHEDTKSHFICKHSKHSKMLENQAQESEQYSW